MPQAKIKGSILIILFSPHCHFRSTTRSCPRFFTNLSIHVHLRSHNPSLNNIISHMDFSSDLLADFTASLASLIHFPSHSKSVFLNLKSDYIYIVLYLKSLHDFPSLFRRRSNVLPKDCKAQHNLAQAVLNPLD